MGYEYGIKQCRETLLALSSDRLFEERLGSAFSEIGVIRASDVSKAHGKEIKDWRSKYLAVRDFEVNKEGQLVEIDREKEFRELTTTLIFLCTEIIEHNSKNSKKKN